jgi:hypothetical protein
MIADVDEISRHINRHNCHERRTRCKKRANRKLAGTIVPTRMQGTVVQQ